MTTIPALKRGVPIVVADSLETGIPVHLPPGPGHRPLINSDSCRTPGARQLSGLAVHTGH